MVGGNLLITFFMIETKMVRGSLLLTFCMNVLMYISGKCLPNSSNTEEYNFFCDCK